MKTALYSAVLCMILLAILTQGLGCINVDAPEKSDTEEVQALGGSNGYLLLKHSDGKFYVVHLETATVREVQGLSQADLSEY